MLVSTEGGCENPTEFHDDEKQLKRQCGRAILFDSFRNLIANHSSLSQRTIPTVLLPSRPIEIRGLLLWLDGAKKCARQGQAL